MEKRADLIIRDARDQTGNQNYTSTQGIKQREMVRHLNAGQTRIYNKMLQERSSLFLKKAFLDTTLNTAEITLPTDIFLKHNIVKVEYSFNGDERNYTPLDLRTPRQEVSVAGYPDSYIPRDGVLVLSPKPSASTVNGIRLWYQYTIPTLDVSRAVPTIIDNGSGIHQFTLSAPSTRAYVGTTFTETEEDLAGGYVDYCCLVDPYSGAILARNLLCGQYNTTTHSMFVQSSSATETLAAYSNLCYLVFGKYASTHSSLDDVCERYLTDYLALRIQMRDSNTESADTSPIIQALEREILDAVAELEEDIPAIPILDTSMLNYADDL